MYSVVDSQKGSNVIHFQDNLYRLQKCNKNGSTRWVCTNRYCSSSITIRNEIIQNQRGQHNHNNVKRSVSIIKAVKDMRHEIRNNISKPVTQIYSEFVSEYVNRTCIFFFLRHIFRDISMVLLNQCLFLICFDQHFIVIDQFFYRSIQHVCQI